MTSHAAHPPTLRTGLADGCERCAEHAARPFDALDPAHLRAFAQHAMLVHDGQASWRSGADRECGERILDTIWRARKLEACLRWPVDDNDELVGLWVIGL